MTYLVYSKAFISLEQSFPLQCEVASVNFGWDLIHNKLVNLIIYADKQRNKHMQNCHGYIYFIPTTWRSFRC